MSVAIFTGNRYITCGVGNEIPVELQMILWDMIDGDKQQGKTLDYLQIFKLRPIYENGVEMQEITHSQEQPRRRKKITIESGNPITAKIFVIDNADYVTMLLNHEY